MKFGSILKDSAADLPDTEELFLKYKQLKKSLKRMHATPDNNNGSHHRFLPTTGAAAAAAGGGGDKEEIKEFALKRKRAEEESPFAAPPQSKKEEDKQKAANQIKKDKIDENPATVTANKINNDQAIGGGGGGDHILLDAELEAEFLRAITADVMELNDRYIEKEEDNVITYEQLEAAAEVATTADACAAVYRAFVDFHGEQLMLFHWSVLAYTGLVKILKKHRKRTGAPLHAPHLENLLSQPFCSVEVTCEMIRRAEEWVVKLAKEMSVVPPPPVPLPDSLLVGSIGGGAAAAINIITTRGSSESFPRSSADQAHKGKVLEAVAAAVEVAEAAEVAAAGAGVAVVHENQKVEGDGGNNGGSGNNNNHLVINKQARRGDKDNDDDKDDGIAAAASGDNVATRRIRAALHVWEQLQTNASTPSTCIVGGGGGISTAAAAAAAVLGMVTVPSNLTNSSVA